MGWINLVWKFLRLGPLPIGAIALLVLAAGYVLQVMRNEHVAKEAQALQAGLPEMVQLADARTAEQRSVIGEVNVQAQLVWNHSYDLWYEENIGTDFVVMFPLIAANSTSLDDVLGVAILQAEDESFETLSEDMVNRWLVADGAHGPIMNLNGELESMGKWEGLIEESFYDEGLTLPADPIVIWPYVEGREVALAPPKEGALTIFGILSKVAGAIGLLALAKMVFSTKDSGATARGRPEDAMPPPVPATNMAGQDVPTQAHATSNVPLWKQRSGLGDPNDYTPQDTVEHGITDPSPMMDPLPPQLETKPRRSFGLRKALIGIVGCLFAVGLISTVVDLIDISPQTSPVKVTSSQDLLAARTADAIVPDADPNRSWTEIDVTPVVEWFVAKFYLALAGDTDAQMTLGMIVGGVLFALFLLKFYFRLRRAMQPRTTARIGSMGLN